MIIPCGNRVLVRPLKLEEADPLWAKARAAGLVRAETEQGKRDVVDQGVVIKIGPNAWDDFTPGDWCAEGDTVGFTKYGGKIVEDAESGEKYFLMEDIDILCILKKGA